MDHNWGIVQHGEVNGSSLDINFYFFSHFTFYMNVFNKVN
jgi:hypothetical protein